LPLSIAVCLMVTACSDSKSAPAAKGNIDRTQVDAAVAKLRTRITATMKDTGLPGLAMGVVFDDKVVATEGFGLRTLGQAGAVDADTVFQLASVSKSLGGSVMASLVGQKAFAWDDPVRTADPGFALADPWVSDHVTYADLYSHRTGLPEHAGDLVEDLGYDRAAVLQRLRLYPLDPFRSSYHYTNFGMTEAGVAGAAKAGMTWEDASRKEIYEPLGMTSTSSTYADFISHPDRASGHITKDGKWMVTPQQRQPDAQSPAGGASSSVNDMTKWLRMEIGGGMFEGRQIVDADALAQTWLPHSLANPPRTPTDRSGFYGLGLNVSYDDSGRLKLGHSGAFALGTGTAFTFFPAEKIGVVVLTNGEPSGIGEAMVESFYDDLFRGQQTRDWVPFLKDIFAQMLNPPPEKDFAHPPANAATPAADATYVGTYANDLFGPLEVATAPGGGLQIRIGPAGQTYALHPYDGNEMWWQFAGENAGPPAAATFGLGPDGRASSLTLANFHASGLGTFTRAGG
jgi:CubicO group peptidase (beta-lactamase class C family)